MSKKKKARPQHQKQVKDQLKKPEPVRVKQKATTETSSAFAFGRENYKLLLIGLAFIIVGFLLMIGGGSDDPNIFSEDVFSFRRMTLAPILILAGYVIEIFAIMKKPKE
ncbi:MAG: DUF3098 domain-containing protein [Bacteroidetes bacterium]|nr:DUF3098 domain-containing protein [Bacteroidota bacterium]